MTEILNLDARRAEVLHTPKKVQLAGVVYDLPPELPLAIGEYLAQGRFSDAMRLLFGDGTDAVMTFLTLDDITAICSQLYGIELPESSASSSS